MENPTLLRCLSSMKMKEGEIDPLQLTGEKESTTMAIIRITTDMKAPDPDLPLRPRILITELPLQRTEEMSNGTIIRVTTTATPNKITGDPTTTVPRQLDLGSQPPLPVQAPLCPLMGVTTQKSDTRPPILMDLRLGLRMTTACTGKEVITNVLTTATVPLKIVIWQTATPRHPMKALLVEKAVLTCILTSLVIPTPSLNVRLILSLLLLNPTKIKSSFETPMWTGLLRVKARCVLMKFIPL